MAGNVETATHTPPQVGTGNVTTIVLSVHSVSD